MGQEDFEKNLDRITTNRKRDWIKSLSQNSARMN